MILEHNVSQNLVIERQATQTELELLSMENEQELKMTKLQADKKVKRDELLAKIGLTEEEAKLLLS